MTCQTPNDLHAPDQPRAVHISDSGGRLIRDSAAAFIASIGTYILAFVTLLIMARLLGPAGRGELSLLTLIATLGATVTSGGLGLAATYLVASSKYSATKVASTLNLLSLILCPLLSVAFFFGLMALSGPLNIPTDPLRSAVCAALLGTTLWLVLLQPILTGLKLIVQYGLIQLCQAAATLVFSVVFVVALSGDVSAALLGALAGTLVAGVVCQMLLARRCRLLAGFDLGVIGKAWAYGIKAHVGTIIQTLNYRLDLFLLAALTDLSHVGWYSISVALSETVWLLPNSVSIALMPHVATGTEHATPRAARHTLALVTLASIVLALLVWPLLEFLLPQFLPAMGPLLVLLPGTIALSASKILCSDLAGRGRPQYASMSAVLGCAITVVLNLLLIPRWGMLGAATASSTTYIVITLFIAIVYLRVSHCKATDLVVMTRSDWLEYVSWASRARAAATSLLRGTSRT